MIKIMIERQVAVDLEKHYQQCAKSTLQTAMNSHGFLSGESLQDHNDPNHRIIFATYRTLNDWLQWHQSKQRQEIMDQLRPMLVDDEKITIMEHV